ncbi:hypothetical protein PG993_009224 [Apiospora rasikravindrae]|uniref:Uncharacterized protein n=1 Tax=Apiospora rasikravindrae TaxID=990691 RepID=A0ABR1SIS6_9PEZI
MADRTKRPVDLEKAKKVALHLARVAAAVKMNMTQLDAEVKSLKRNMWRIENEVSECRNAHLTSTLASIRERLDGVDQSQVNARRELKDTTAQIKQILRQIKKEQTSPDGRDGQAVKGN